MSDQEVREMIDVLGISSNESYYLSQNEIGMHQVSPIQTEVLCTYFDTYCALEDQLSSVLDAFKRLQKLQKAN